MYEYDRTPGIGKHVEQLRLTHQGAESVARSSASGKTIRQAFAKVKARPPIHADQLHCKSRVRRNSAQMQLTMAGMFQQIGRQLRRSKRYATGICLIEAQRARHRQRNAPGMANLTFFFDRHYGRRAALDAQDHLTILMRVPAPGELSNSNSSTRRLAPVSPSPRPLPEVQPSVIASLISGIPGPSSRNVSRMPERGPWASTCQSISPPPP